MKITKDRTFRCQVKVAYPDGDAFDTQVFTATFKALKMSEFEGFNISTVEGQNIFLRNIVVGWDGISDDRDGKNEPFAFTPENFDELLEDAFTRNALLNAWGTAIAGVKRGN